MTAILIYTARASRLITVTSLPGVLPIRGIDGFCEIPTSCGYHLLEHSTKMIQSKSSHPSVQASAGETSEAWSISVLWLVMFPIHKLYYPKGRYLSFRVSIWQRKSNSRSKISQPIKSLRTPAFEARTSVQLQVMRQCPPYAPL